MIVQIEGIGHVVIGRTGKTGTDRMAEERYFEGCWIFSRFDGDQVARPTGFGFALLSEFGQKMDDGRFGAFRDADEGRPFAKFGLAARSWALTAVRFGRYCSFHGNNSWFCTLSR